MAELSGVLCLQLPELCFTTCRELFTPIGRSVALLSVHCSRQEGNLICVDT